MDTETKGKTRTWLLNRGLDALLDLLIFGFMGKKSGEGKVLKPEEAKEIAKKIFPHILGLGPEDEAIFTATMAKLEDRRNVKISRWLDKLHWENRRLFRMIITVLPDEKDRINILNMLSGLPEKEMTAVAKACHLISSGRTTLEIISEEGKKVVTSIQNAYTNFLTHALPWLEAVNAQELEVVYPRTAALVNRINQGTQQRRTSLFGRLASRIP